MLNDIHLFPSVTRGNHWKWHSFSINFRIFLPALIVNYFSVWARGTLIFLESKSQLQFLLCEREMLIDLKNIGITLINVQMWLNLGEKFAVFLRFFGESLVRALKRFLNVLFQCFSSCLLRCCSDSMKLETLPGLCRAPKILSRAGFCDKLQCCVVWHRCCHGAMRRVLEPSLGDSDKALDSAHLVNPHK